MLSSRYVSSSLGWMWGVCICVDGLDADHKGVKGASLTAQLTF
jgi:hypothetical protein